MKTSKKKRTYPLPVELIDTLERASYWRHTPQVGMVVEALEKYFQGEKFKEIPKK